MLFINIRKPKKREGHQMSNPSAQEGAGHVEIAQVCFLQLRFLIFSFKADKQKTLKLLKLNCTVLQSQ